MKQGIAGFNLQTTEILTEVISVVMGKVTDKPLLIGGVGRGGARGSGKTAVGSSRVETDRGPRLKTMNFLSEKSGGKRERRNWQEEKVLSPYPISPGEKNGEMVDGCVRKYAPGKGGKVFGLGF